MPNQDKRGALVAFAKVGGKSGKPSLPNLNVCGDVGLKIARDGTWLYQGGPIRRKPLVKLFASVLRREDGGGFYLVTPVEKVPIAVEGEPFVAIELERKGSGKAQQLNFRTNVDDVVTAGPEHPIGFAPGSDGPTPFVVVRDALRARLARPVYYELAELAIDDGPESEFGVWSGGMFFPFPGSES